MARDVILRATFSELVGDETFELWLKHDGEWTLNQADDVVLDSGHQDFTILSLTTGDAYVAQVRLKRAGRYRVGYLTSNPDTWDDQSRCEFRPGDLVGVGAPTLSSAVWTRVSPTGQHITLSITPDDLNTDIQITRDGEAIAVVSAPFTGAFTYDDENPPTGVSHAYTCAHVTSGGLAGASSAEVDCFGGPLPPSGVARTTADDHFAFYTLVWDADSDPVRIQDDFLCATFFVDQLGGSGTTTNSTEDIHKEDHLIPNDGEQAATFTARVRREVAFVDGTDVSDWVEVAIAMHIETTNTDYLSCP
jgi:hypothetical protein